MPRPARRALPAPLALVLLTACGGPSPEAPARPAAPAVTNRVPIPPEVVGNLGITFEKARRGRLDTRLRVPGHVEVAPEARYVVRAPAEGRIVLRTARWQRVAKGEVVAEVLSPDLRRAQEDLSEAVAALERTSIDLVRARAEAAPLAVVAGATEEALAAARQRESVARAHLADARRHEQEAHERAAATERLTGQNGLATAALFAARKEHVDAQASALEAAERLDETRAAIGRLTLEAASARARAETSDRETAILEGRRRTQEAGVRQRLRSLAVLTGIEVEALAAASADGPAWARLDAVPIRAPADGLVVEVSASDAEWVEAAGPLLRIVDPARKVFRGEVPESDVARIPPRASVRIEVGARDGARIETELGDALPLADPRTRTVLVEARLPGDGSAWADGSSATAAVLLERSAAEETLVPAACVVQDELESVVFRRDPANPALAIRTPVALGRRSDGWVEVLSEVAEGDEVVRHGVHQLRLTGGGKAPAKGHFHADGTWHEGED